MKKQRFAKERNAPRFAGRSTRGTVAGTPAMTPPAAAASEELVGRFVRLRPLHVDDAALTLRWRQSTRAALLNRGAQTVEEQAAWIAGRPPSEYNFVIEVLASCQPVGMLSLVGVDPVHRRGEPARFLIGEQDAVRGVPVAVEAMQLLYELAFDRLGLVRVYGTVAADNPLMLKWQRFLGMKEEGRLRSHYFLDGHFQDAICVGLLADEYRTITLPKMRALIAAARSGSQDTES